MSEWLDKATDDLHQIFSRQRRDSMTYTEFYQWKVNDLEAKLHNKSLRLEELRRELEEALAHIVELEDVVRTHERSLDSAEREWCNGDDLIEALQAENKWLKENLGGYKEALDSAEIEWNRGTEIIETLQEENKKLKSKHDNLMTLLTQYVKNYEMQGAEVHRLKREMAAKTALLDEHKKVIRESHNKLQELGY